MKTFRNIMICILILLTTAIVLGCTVYNYKMSPVSNSSEEIEVVIPSGSSIKAIGALLEEKGLIRDKDFFVIYAHLFHIDNVKASTYHLSPNMGVPKIAEIIQEGNSYNPDSITITFKEGLNIRQIAKVIEENTDNHYDEVIAKASDETYLRSLIEKYWFLDESILGPDIYYGLEGYLFPNTYRFTNKQVTIETIFETMLDQMGKELEPYREEIEKQGKSVHAILTMASMVEKEGATHNEEDQVLNHVASVFYNRIDRNMSLGSDVTTRYALQIDDAQQKLTTEQYQTKSPYNTRLTDGSMNGKLPVGPICGPGRESIKAAIYPSDTNDIYFIANIVTKETFFFDNSRDFERKKQELQSVNQGL